MNADDPPRLLGPNDPDPVEWVRKDSPSPLLLVCEHAGNAIPEALGDLGVTADIVDSHRGLDIGAEPLARALSDRLDAPLVLQRYSRLVIDGNRPPDGPHAVPAISDRVVIPANENLSAENQAARANAIFRPFDAAVSAGFERHPRRLTLSVHSFTDRLEGQPPRPWHAGFLARKDLKTSKRLKAHIGERAPDLVLGINQPYQIDDETDWFIPVHAERRGLAHALIEIRNDGLRRSADTERWANLLSDAIAALPEFRP